MRDRHIDTFTNSKLVEKRRNHSLQTTMMYHAACKVEFQPFKRSYSQLTFFNFLWNHLTRVTKSYLLALGTTQISPFFFLLQCTMYKLQTSTRWRFVFMVTCKWMNEWTYSLLVPVRIIADGQISPSSNNTINCCCTSICWRSSFEPSRSRSTYNTGISVWKEFLDGRQSRGKSASSAISGVVPTNIYCYFFCPPTKYVLRYIFQSDTKIYTCLLYTSPSPRD